MPDIKYFWLRDSRRNPVAVVAYYIHYTGWMIHSVATRNPKDNFSKITARQVAADRLNLLERGTKPLKAHADTLTPYDQRIEIRKAIIADRAIPQRARVCAALWFTTYPQVDRRTKERRRLAGKSETPWSVCREACISWLRSVWDRLF